jgi:hypothetical protein
MNARPFDGRPLFQSSLAEWPDAPDGRPLDSEHKGRAIAELLRHGVLSHTFGPRREYEVRTTMSTRQAWQYRCCILRHGKAIKRGFSPISIDRTRHMQHVRTESGVTEATRLSLAREAVDVHFARCGALQEYLLLASIYFQPPLKSRRRYSPLVLLIGAAILTAYGLWQHALWNDNGQPPRSPPAVIQGEPHPVVDEPPPGPPLSAPRPALSDEANRDLAAEPARAPRPDRLAGTPKTVQLSDLLAVEDPAERADHAPRAPTPQIPPGSTASDVQAGDLLFLTGWIHRISRAPDNTYRLQVRTSRQAGAPGLIAVVPPPDQASGSPSMQAQLQAVRVFITRRLLRQQEPSLRGSVMRNPIAVQLTGQLSYPDPPLVEPSHEKGPRDATTRWELHPVIEIRFATSLGSSDRSRLE